MLWLVVTDALELGHVRRCRLLMLVWLTASVAALEARAQSASSEGIRVGEGRLHPFLEVDGRYDSFVGFFSGTNANLLPSADIILHARPGVKFDLTNPSTSVLIGAAAEYLFYTGWLTPQAAQLSRWPTGLRANVNAETKFNQDGAVEVQLGDQLLRTDRSQNPVAGVGVLSLANDIHVALPIHPGGRALEITPRVAWQVELFEAITSGLPAGCTAGDQRCDPALVARMNYSNVALALNARWRFFPKTAVVVDVASDLRSYFNNTSGNPGASLLRAQAGLAGLVTSRINVTLLGGYAGDLAPAATGVTRLQSFIANAEVGYTPNEMMRVSLGYQRTALPTPLYGTYTDDRGTLRGMVGLWAGRLTLTAQLGLDALSFSRAPGSTDATTRSDLAFSGAAGIAVAALSWFDVSAGYQVSTRTSSLSTLSSINYVRHEVTLRLAIHY